MSYKRCRIYQNCTLLNDRVYVYSPLYLPSWPFHTLPSRVRKFRLHWYYCIHILIRILVSMASYWWNIFHSKKYSHFKGATSKYQYKVNPRLTNKSHLYTQSSFSTHQNMFSQNVCDPLSNSFNDYDYIKKKILNIMVYSTTWNFLRLVWSLPIQSYCMWFILFWHSVSSELFAALKVFLLSFFHILSIHLFNFSNGIWHIIHLLILCF